MKDSSVFSPGRSNFGLLLSESENSSAEVSDNEAPVQSKQVVSQAEETHHESEAADEDDWGVVTKKHPKNPSAHPKSQTPRREHYPSKTVFIGNGTKKLPQTGPTPHHHAPVAIEDIKAETALELYGFPSKYRTSHLRKFVDSVTESAGAGYRLKWQNDSSCWVVFDEPEMLKKALNELHDEVIQVRPFAAENLVITAETHAATEAAAAPLTVQPEANVA